MLVPCSMEAAAGDLSDFQNRRQGLWQGGTLPQAALLSMHATSPIFSPCYRLDVLVSLSASRVASLTNSDYFLFHRCVQIGL